MKIKFALTIALLSSPLTLTACNPLQADKSALTLTSQSLSADDGREILDAADAKFETYNTTASRRGPVMDQGQQDGLRRLVQEELTHLQTLDSAAWPSALEHRLQDSIARLEALLGTIPVSVQPPPPVHHPVDFPVIGEPTSASNVCYVKTTGNSSSVSRQTTCSNTETSASCAARGQQASANGHVEVYFVAATSLPSQANPCSLSSASQLTAVLGQLDSYLSSSGIAPIASY